MQVRALHFGDAQQRLALIQKETESLLVVQDLSVSFTSSGRQTRIVNSISFSITPGEVVGVLGESGSGKTSMALAVLGLLPSNAQIESGSVRLHRRESLRLGERPFQNVPWLASSRIF